MQYTYSLNYHSQPSILNITIIAIKFKYTIIKAILITNTCNWYHHEHNQLHLIQYHIHTPRVEIYHILHYVIILNCHHITITNSYTTTINQLNIVHHIYITMHWILSSDFFFNRDILQINLNYPTRKTYYKQLIIIKK